MAKQDPITVFENLSDNIITFDNEQEFMRYYEKNRESIDSMATRGLNTKFKIEGFKIGRRNKNIILFPIKTEQPSVEVNSNSESLKEEIQDLRERIDLIGDLLNKLIKQLSKMNPNSQSQSSYTSEAVDTPYGSLRKSYR